MDRFVALRLAAIQAVQNPDDEAHERFVFRWYSKTFHTPLHVVADLDLDDVFTAFYESTYEEMTDEDRRKEIQELLETDEERNARLRAKDEEDADAFEYARFTAQEEARKAEAKRLADLQVADKPTRFKKVEAPPTRLPMGDVKELPPNIEMRFVGDDEFESLLEEQSLKHPAGPR